MFTKIIEVYLLIICLLIIIQCTHTTTGTTDETVGGIKVAYEDGKPAEKSLVKVFRAGDTSKIIVAAGYTNSQGIISFSNIGEGFYAVSARKDTLAAFTDSIFVNNKMPLSDTLILKKTGSIKGILSIQPIDDPRSFYIIVMGTDIFAEVERDGTFFIKDIAEGFYTIVIQSALGTYTPKFVKVRVYSDSIVTLDTIKPYYLDIPVIPEIKASYNPYEGIVTLSWNSLDYYLLEEYVVVIKKDSYRYDTIFTVDTLFRDTLNNCEIANWNAMRDTSIYEIIYSVAIKNKKEEIGFFYPKRKLSTVCKDFVHEFFLYQDNQTISFVRGFKDKEVKFIAHSLLKIDSINSLIYRKLPENNIIIEKKNLTPTNFSFDTITLIFTETGLYKLQLETKTTMGYTHYDTIPILIAEEKEYNITDKTLIGYWNFDEGKGNIIYDASGNLHIGYADGCSWTEGIEGKALYFDGNDKVIINHDTEFENQELTISLWVWLDTLKDYSSILTKKYNYGIMPAGYRI
ncbi:MAG: hypothetical protein N2053_02635 [Chitinispirillaceae bacterium]|nr:hypothetical protein [Chitinispirillaceae bacterium]